jgi:transcriptional regulator with XRE-family HTH domain
MCIVEMVFNRLRDLRKKDLGISSTEILAEKLGGDASGWYHQKIQRIESGKTALTDKDANDLAVRLKIPVYSLFVDPETVYPAEHRRIVAAYLALNDGIREAVDRIIFTDQGEQNDPLAQNLPQHGTLHDAPGEMHRPLTEKELADARRRLRGEI